MAALRELGVRAVMLSGDSRQTAERVAAEVGIGEVLAEVLPGEKAAKVADLQQQGGAVAMVGDRVNDAPPLAQADVGVAIGAGTDVAVETADIVLMRSDPLDVATAIKPRHAAQDAPKSRLGRRLQLARATAGGVFAPLGFTLSPAVGALSMSGSSILVAVNAVLLKRLPLSRQANA